MRILVTGGSGFLGSALIRKFEESGHIARGFSRRETPNGIVGDITNLNSISTAVDQFEPEVIYNLASQTDLAAFSDGITYDANTVGVANLVKAVEGSSGVKRVIWVSSQLVNRPGHVPHGDQDYDPVGGYGESKVEGEKIVHATAGGGKEWVIVRPTTVWGPGMSPHYQRLLSMIRRGLYFHVGRKPIYKSYSYIDNLTHQMERFATADRHLIDGKTFYAADSQPIELRDWCDGFAQQLGKSIPTLPKTIAIALAKAGDVTSALGIKIFPLNSSRLSNMLTEYVFDTSKIEKVCGPTPISNQEGIRRTAAWWMKQR